MEYVRIKHGEHEIEVEGSPEFIEAQIQNFYVSISHYNEMKKEEN